MVGGGLHPGAVGGGVGWVSHYPLRTKLWWLSVGSGAGVLARGGDAGWRIRCSRNMHTTNTFAAACICLGAECRAAAAHPLIHHFCLLMSDSPHFPSTPPSPPLPSSPQSVSHSLLPDAMHLRSLSSTGSHSRIRTSPTVLQHSRFAHAHTHAHRGNPVRVTRRNTPPHTQTHHTTPHTPALVHPPTHKRFQGVSRPSHTHTSASANPIPPHPISPHPIAPSSTRSPKVHHGTIKAP